MSDLGGMITIGDFSVPRMGFGAMQLTGPGVWGDPEDREGAIAVLRRVRDLGVQLFDTAWAYGPETNEALVADALQPYGDTVVATKTGNERTGPREWHQDGRPSRIREMTESSLKSLGVDTIDLMQLHAPDKNVPYEETIGVLADLKNEGKIRNVGLSNINLEQLAAAQRIVPIVSVQQHYSLGHREEHEAVLRACETQNIAFLAYRPVQGGALASSPGALSNVAQRHNATTAQIALAWLLQRSPVVVPIPGTSSIEHAEENIAATEIVLTPDDLEELENG